MYLPPHEGDALMLAARRRTYLPMSVLAGMLAVTLVVYILLYRKLSPPRPAFTGGALHHDSDDEEAVSLHVMSNGSCRTEGEEEEEELTEEDQGVETDSEYLTEECNSTLL